MEPVLQIRELADPTTLAAVADLQARVWGAADVVPVHQTLTAVRHGGLVLGAFVGGELAAFLYAFPGWDGQEVHLCSHMLAVAPEFRRLGLGRALKWAQRDWALARGYRLVTWTYDPLETVNAHLNLTVLGAVADGYLADCYGAMDDPLNQGLATDRCLVRWHVASDRVATRARGDPPVRQVAALPAVLAAVVRSDGWPVPGDVAVNLTGPRLVMSVPAQFQALKRADLELGRRWRAAVRQALVTYMARGYRASECQLAAGEPLGWYLLVAAPAEGG